MTVSPVSVSIVVPVGRVDAPTLAQLDAIRQLRTDDIDVELVLSSNNADPVHARALAAAVEAFPFRTVIVDSSDARGAAHARNVGAAAARGDVLAFCDADDLVEPEWLVELVRSLEHHDAVSGRLVELVERERDRGLRPPATPDGLPRFLGFPYLLSGNLAVTAATFRESGGFDTTLVRCEDTAWSWRLSSQGRRLGYAPGAVVHYRMRSGLVAMMRQQFMYGRGASQLLVRQGLPHSSGPDGGSRAALLRANGQPGGRGSYVRLLRRGATAAGRLVGLAEEGLGRARGRAGARLVEVGPGDPARPRPDERLLWVADAGGHLLEGTVMQHLLYDGLAITWYTADTRMSRSLLRDRSALFARRRVLPRRPDLAVRELGTALRMLRSVRPDVVVSTGSAVALPWLVAAVVTGRRAIFHESAARLTAPSLTGRLIEHVPRVERYTQQPMMLPARRAARWRRSRSTLELARDLPRIRPDRVARMAGPPRLFVTVGTYEYPFTRLFQRLESLVPSDWDIVWQIGHAGDHRPARGEVHDFLDYDRVVAEVTRADLVVTHAGVGSILTVLQAGRCPTVVARRRRHGEIADDHQLEVLAALRSVGIDAFADVDDLTGALFTCAAPRHSAEREG